MSLGGKIRRTLFWINDFCHGSKVRRHYIDLKLVLADAVSGKETQKMHLKNILLYMSEYSPYYMKYKGREIQDYPIVDKNFLNSHKEELLVPMQYIPEQKGDLYIQRTSGSTGTPLAIPMDTQKRNRRVAELKFFNECIGIKSHEPIGQCRIWTKWQTKGKWQSFRENIIPINISVMDEDTICRLIEVVYKKGTIMLKAYASWYTALVEYLKKHPENCYKLKSLRLCLSGSEALPETTKNDMLQLTGIPIIEQYASEEAGVVGQQLLDMEGFILNHSGYYIEYLKLNSDEPAEYGELGRIVITDLFNHAFPMIRYDTGDTAIFSEGNKRSNGWPYITKLYGRKMDLIYDTQGRPLHAMNFARVLKNLPGIIQYQFAQTGRTEYTVRLNMEEKSEVISTIEEIKNIVGQDATINVSYVNEIPVLASGKRKPVVQEWIKQE